MLLMLLLLCVNIRQPLSDASSSKVVAPVLSGERGVRE